MNPYIPDITILQLFQIWFLPVLPALPIAWATGALFVKKDLYDNKISYLKALVYTVYESSRYLIAICTLLALGVAALHTPVMWLLNFEYVRRDFILSLINPTILLQSILVFKALPSLIPPAEIPDPVYTRETYWTWDRSDAEG